MTDHDPWQRLEADFARVLGEIPKPEGPAQSADAATRGRGIPMARDSETEQAAA